MKTVAWAVAIACVFFTFTAKTQYIGPASDSASAPGHTWSGDANTGIFRPGAGVVGVSTTGVERLRVNSTGVGIGTSTPARLLNVGGAIRLNPVATPGSPAAGDVFIDSGASNNLKYHNGTSWISISSGAGDFMANGSVPMTGNLRLNNRWLSGDGGNEGVFVSATGWVGIGMSSPGGNLQVDSSAGDVDVTFSSSAANASSILNLHSRQGSATRFTYMMSDWPGNLKFRSHSGAYQFWNAADTNMLMNVLPSGNVGIGISNPLAPLNVLRNQGSNTDILVENNSLGTNASAGLSLVTDEGALQLRAYNASQADSSIVSDSGTSILASGVGPLTIASGSSPIRLTTGSTVRAVVTTTGEVGIGTTAPGRLLHVAGPMRIAPSALPGAPATGDMAVDSGDGNRLKVYNGSGWLSAVGEYAIYNYNTTTYTPTGGLNSPFVGENAMYNTNSANGMAMVSRIGVRNSTGDYQNSYIGAVSNASGYTPTMVFGHQTALSSYSERMRIDVNGNLGIGTTNPTTRLHIAGTVRTTGTVSGFQIARRDTSADAWQFYSSAGNLQLYDNVNAVDRMTITPSGTVGIGSTSPLGTLHVLTSSGSTAVIEHSGSGTQTAVAFRQGAPSAQVGSITVSGGSSTAYNTTSDKRTKENIRPSSMGLRELLRLPVREYSYKNDVDHHRVNGFLAQELYEIYPEAVTTNGDDGQAPLNQRAPWSVDYGRLTPLLANSIKDLASIVDVSKAPVGRAALSIDSSGNVGVGVAAPTAKLHVAGPLRVQGATDCTLGNGSGGANCSSDIRLKDNVRQIDHSLDKILSLRGVDFVWNDKSQSPGRPSIGVIAQDVEQVFPSAVVDDSGSGYKKVDYAVLVAPIIQAIKELVARFEASSSLVKRLSSRLESLEIENKELRAQNSKMAGDLRAIREHICSENSKASVCKLK